MTGVSTRYGLAKPLSSFDPITANFEHAYRLYKSVFSSPVDNINSDVPQNSPPPPQQLQRQQYVGIIRKASPRSSTRIKTLGSVVASRRNRSRSRGRKLKNDENAADDAKNLNKEKGPNCFYPVTSSVSLDVPTVQLSTPFFARKSSSLTKAFDLAELFFIKRRAHHLLQLQISKVFAPLHHININPLASLQPLWDPKFTSSSNDVQENMSNYKKMTEDSGGNSSSEETKYRITSQSLGVNVHRDELNAVVLYRGPQLSITHRFALISLFLATLAFSLFVLLAQSRIPPGLLVLSTIVISILLHICGKVADGKFI